MQATETPDIEAVLRDAGATGMTVVELVHALDLAETTVRRKIKTLIAEGKAHKVPTLEGQRIVYGDGTAPVNRPQRSNDTRRRNSRARDEQVHQLLENAGSMGMELEDIAREISAEDITPAGFSQKTYLSLRRGKRAGKFERIIRWRLVPEGESGS